MSLRIAAFGYHEVTDHPEESGFQRPRAVLYKHPVRTFKAHLDAIAAAGTPPELVHEIDFGGAGDHLVLTFDDGGRSASRISDELVRRGWRGHFLVVTGLSGQPTFLDRAGVLALRRAGHVVGSHSHSHPEVFRRLSMSAMLEQWRTSCDRLAQWLGEGCAVASVPGGEISDAVLESAQRSGIEYLFTSEPW